MPIAPGMTVSGSVGSSAVGVMGRLLIAGSLSPYGRVYESVKAGLTQSYSLNEPSSIGARRCGAERKKAVVPEAETSASGTTAVYLSFLKRLSWRLPVELEA